MTRNPTLNALAAVGYIVLVSVFMFYVPKYLGQGQPDNVFAPIILISLFTLSAAVMGYVFLYTPFVLYFDNQRKEAVRLFLKTVGIFAVFWVIILALFAWKSSGVSPSSEQSIGGQKDENGCLTAAGYSWCEAKQKCLRSWEEYCTAAVAKVAVFKCAGSKGVQATFYPADDKYVDLVLSDERQISLPRAVSASGARYVKADESFVFWNKGDTATITENNKEAFAGCVVEEVEG